VEALAAEGDEVYVTALAGEKATVMIRRRVPTEVAAARVASDLRIAAAERLAGDTP
jgi:hypothetical protein